MHHPDESYRPIKRVQMLGGDKRRPRRGPATSQGGARSQRRRWVVFIGLLKEIETTRTDAVFDNLVTHRTPPMLHDTHHPGHPVTQALTTQDEDRVGGGSDVARRDLARE